MNIVNCFLVFIAMLYTVLILFYIITMIKLKNSASYFREGESNPRYGSLYNPLIPDERTFELGEVVYYKGSKWFVEYWSRHHWRDNSNLHLIKYNGCQSESISPLDSREVKKIKTLYAKLGK